MEHVQLVVWVQRINFADHLVTFTTPSTRNGWESIPPQMRYRFNSSKSDIIRGGRFEAYTVFLPKSEAHSIEISCLPEGPQSEGLWPYGNFAIKRDIDLYDKLRANSRLHCGDANKVSFLNEVWSQQMNRIDAPPLKVVIDDASHQSQHMVASVFFWFPRIAPRGVMIVEDIQPSIADRFRTQFLPQMMKDMHFCGNNNFPDEQCFSTL